MASVPAQQIKAADPEQVSHKQRVGCASPKIPLNHIGTNVFVADIQGIRTLVLSDMRGALDTRA
eukprot:7537713-Lingulodinium_polyedra.AAC.1